MLTIAAERLFPSQRLTAQGRTRTVKADQARDQPMGYAKFTRELDQTQEFGAAAC
jgi:hypothetical protein